MQQGNGQTDEAETAVRLRGVDKNFGDVEALKDLSFDVATGKFFVLFGPSSVGKTTTLRAIAGLEKINAGKIELNGRDVADAPIRGRGVAMVFQSFALYPHLSVADNFAYPLKESGLPAAEIKQRIGETVEMLSLSHRTGNLPSTLSGGEQQRVALGRALIQRPNILLLDEPLTNLDAKLRHDMRAELKRLHRQFGMTIIYATPDELEALSMGEDIAVMEEGHVVQQGSPDELYETPDNLYVAAKIGSPHMNLLDVSVNEDGDGLQTPFGPLETKRPQVSGDEAIVMGIRPSDIRLARDAEPHLNLKVQLVEPLGDITVVSVDVAGSSLRLVLPEAGALGVKPGHELPIVIPPERVHLFRKADGTVVSTAM
ncbi:MAG: ATP-binding cassette domain-containing protein [Rhizobiaceae bacterium]|nr:ATP-binding cassette domain-containing protein [Rhizobiaceae bacterium]